MASATRMLTSQPESTRGARRKTLAPTPETCNNATMGCTIRCAARCRHHLAAARNQFPARRKDYVDAQHITFCDRLPCRSAPVLALCLAGMCRRGRGGMSTAPFSQTPASQVRAVLQALQGVLDLAADAETVTLPTTYVSTWRAQLQRVLDQLDTAAPPAAPMKG